MEKRKIISGTRFLTAMAVGVLSLQPQSVRADAATHKLMLAASTLSRVDCGGGTCTTACSVNATLTNVGHSSSRPISVHLKYKTEANDDGEADVNLDFPDLNSGAKASARDEAYGFTCKSLNVLAVSVDCPGERDEKCPAFYYLHIPENRVLKIKSHKVEGK